MFKGIIIFLIIIGLIMFMVGGSTETIVVASSERPHLIGIADTDQTLNTINVFQAIDFNFLLGDAHEFMPQDNNCIIVMQGGHYFATFEGHFTDTSPAPNGNIGMRISLNGAEVSGSYSEEDTTNQNADITFTTFAYIEALTNDVICLEWTADDIDVKLMSNNTHATQPVVAKGFINWVHAD